MKRYLILAALVAFGCASEVEVPVAEPVAPAAASSAPRIGATVASADGVPIVYDVRGEGAPALVFVHGWSCDRSFWRAQVDEFANDHTVVTLDLAGHGDSGAERDGWSVLGLGADVEAVVRALDLDEVVIVGHSMGAAVALEAARRMPERVVAVIPVDSLHNAEFEPSEAELAQFHELIALLREDFARGVELMFTGMLPTDVDPAVAERIVATAQRTRPAGAIALMEDFLPLDVPALLASAGVPIRAINAAPVPGRFYGTEVEINRRYADFDALLVEDVGHFLQLEQPAEFNVALRQTLAQLARSADGA